MQGRARQGQRQGCRNAHPHHFTTSPTSATPTHCPPLTPQRLPPLNARHPALWANQLPSPLRCCSPWRIYCPRPCHSRPPTRHPPSFTFHRPPKPFGHARCTRPLLSPTAYRVAPVYSAACPSPALRANTHTTPSPRPPTTSPACLDSDRLLRANRQLRRRRWAAAHVTEHARHPHHGLERA